MKPKVSMVKSRSSGHSAHNEKLCLLRLIWSDNQRYITQMSMDYACCFKFLHTFTVEISCCSKPCDEPQGG